MEQSTECGDADGHRMDDSVPSASLSDTVETVIQYGMTMALTMATYKMMSECYKENPALFWGYVRHKHENLIYHCRM